ncbi:MAG TPA: hypothetical protein VEL82_07430 [Thermoplasmata archaeon]|nr:hypothetical protein [Thermoplasmata archaeon]
MATCPACGAETDGAADCPDCHLSAALFDAVREAAGPNATSDATYLRTIGELLGTLDPGAAGIAPTGSDRAAGPGASRGVVVDARVTGATRSSPPISASLELPAVPTVPSAVTELKRRVGDYFELGRRLGLDFTDFSSRANSAALVDDVDSLEVLAREMFVHLSSSIAEEYEACLARRNELAQTVRTPSADVELTAVRRAIGVGDLAGAQRRLAHVRDALARIEEEWEVGRILVTEGEMMSEAIRDLGGDPSPAAGPIEEGRRLFARGRRADAERVLARAAIALWTVLEPRLMADLKRLRDRMVEERAAGLDIDPALRELKALSIELSHRNFAGTVIAYRRLRSTVERIAPAGVEALAAGLGAPESGRVRPA